MLKTGSYLVLLCSSLTAYAAAPSIKVLIGKSLKNVVVQGMDLYQTQFNRVQQFTGRKILSFNCKHSMRRSNRSQALLASLSSPTGLISWGEHKYQGELQLLSRPTSEGCDLVNSIPLEAYIMTLLSKEMNGTWPVEALKAQAVAARTYAYDRVKKATGNTSLYHLESSEKDQVSGSFFDATEKTVQASRETQGEILTGPSGKIAPAFFHSKCGGKTLRPDQVWGGVEEGYRSVACTFCQKTGLKDWQHRLHPKKVVSMVDQVLKKYYADQVDSSDIKLMPDSLQNSEIRLYLGDRLHIIKKSYLRNLAGREALPSNNFIMKMKANGIEVTGKGYGHGVGLCQLGALELAKRGYNYRQILSFYFPRHKLKTVY